MNLIKGNLWDEIGRADLILFTANNVLDKRGHLVMGAGVAKQAKELFPLLPSALGHRLKDCTNYWGVVTVPWCPEYRLGAFQTKYHYSNKSPLELVRRSTEKLALNARQFNRIALNFPGIGLGGLPRAAVLPVIETLPDNVWIYEL